MTLRIRIDHGQDAGKAWRLARTGAYVLGRTPAASHPGPRHEGLEGPLPHSSSRAEDGRTQTVLKDLRLAPRHGAERPAGHGAEGAQARRRDPPRPLDPARPLRRPSAEDAVPTGDGREGAGRDGRRPRARPPKKRKTYATDALVGTEIGGYRVREKIGQGGMGSVYTAEQLSLHREVALQGPQREVHVGQRLRRPVRERGAVGRRPEPPQRRAGLRRRPARTAATTSRWSSSRAAPSRSASPRTAPPEWRDALNWMIDAANALIFAQKRDILHRDVKPDNLMLAEDGSAKLCDLGLAKKAANADMLAAGIIGTPAFISPEAIRRKKDIDVRSDLYSLGCTFYRVLTGENPYPAKTVKEILIGHLKAPGPARLRQGARHPARPRRRHLQAHAEGAGGALRDAPGSPAGARQDPHPARPRGARPAGPPRASRSSSPWSPCCSSPAAGLAFLLTRPRASRSTRRDREAARLAAEREAQLERAEFEDFVKDAQSDLERAQARRRRRTTSRSATTGPSRPGRPSSGSTGRSPTTSSRTRSTAIARRSARSPRPGPRARRCASRSTWTCAAVPTESSSRRAAEAVERFTQEIQGIRAEYDEAVEVQGAGSRPPWPSHPTPSRRWSRPTSSKQVVDVLPAAMSAAGPRASSRTPSCSTSRSTSSPCSRSTSRATPSVRRSATQLETHDHEGARRAS